MKKTKAEKPAARSPVLSGGIDFNQMAKDLGGGIYSYVQNWFEAATASLDTPDQVEAVIKKAPQQSTSYLKACDKWNELVRKEINSVKSIRAFRLIFRRLCDSRSIVQTGTMECLVQKVVDLATTFEYLCRFRSLVRSIGLLDSYLLPAEFFGKMLDLAKSIEDIGLIQEWHSGLKGFEEKLRQAFEVEINKAKDLGKGISILGKLPRKYRSMWCQYVIEKVPYDEESLRKYIGRHRRKYESDSDEVERTIWRLLHNRLDQLVNPRISAMSAGKNLEQLQKLLADCRGLPDSMRHVQIQIETVVESSISQATTFEECDRLLSLTTNHEHIKVLVDQMFKLAEKFEHGFRLWQLASSQAIVSKNVVSGLWLKLAYGDREKVIEVYNHTRSLESFKAFLGFVDTTEKAIYALNSAQESDDRREAALAHLLSIIHDPKQGMSLFIELHDSRYYCEVVNRVFIRLLEITPETDKASILEIARLTRAVRGERTPDVIMAVINKLVPFYSKGLT